MHSWSPQTPWPIQADTQILLGTVDISQSDPELNKTEMPAHLEALLDPLVKTMTVKVPQDGESPKSDSTKVEERQS